MWRDLHPNHRTFSCYSGIYQSFSRIDYYLISSDLRSRIKNCGYDSIIISDHAQISFILQFPHILYYSPKWHLSRTWLRDPEFITFIGKQIDIYFEINTDQTSASVRWEAFERAQMISNTKHKHETE